MVPRRSGSSRSWLWRALLLAGAAGAACSSQQEKEPDHAVSDGGTGEAGANAGGSAGEAHGGRAGSYGGAGTSGATHGGTGSTGGAAAAAGVGEGGAAGEGGEGSAGAAGAGGEGGRASEGRELMYITRLLGGVMSLEVDVENGRPQELPSSPASPGRFLYGLATDSAQRFLFTAEPEPGGHVDSYRIGADGRVEKTPDASLELSDGPISLAVEPDGQFIYVATLDDHALRTFAIEADTGALSLVGAPLHLDTTPSFVAVDPLGRFLFASHGLLPGIHGFRIGRTGALEALDGSPFGATDVRAGALAFSPDGARLYAAGQALYGFDVGATSGALEALEGSPFSTDIGSDAFAVNLAVEPRGEYLYTTAFTTTRHVSGYAIEPNSGALAPVPGSPLQAPSPYSVAVDLLGHFVYVGNDTGELSIFSLDRADGSLKELRESPLPIGGPQPQFSFVRR